ncbi:deoxyribonuclease IV [Aquibacillus albus]|uniref:Deoxyribonuclease-4 n=1 Tax=Aquibacillus albus TaxID=1168171 RepID=A0ABS2N2F4_9BACI|nr:deoxyribonuclease IV [Aquibacillus albus]MBM7572319.1 deoxyribonuclease-4 [Aquibacillus albus]
MKFGCHVSIKEGYTGAAIRAIKLGANAFQFFPKNPRSLSVKAFNRTEAVHCHQKMAENNLVSVAHSPYPTNLTASDDKQDLVVRSLLNDLEIAEACGAIGVVVHFGKQVDKDPIHSYKRMIHTLNTVLKKWEGNGKLLLENNAGKPGTMGTTIEELVQVRKLCDYPEKIGFCFDTCHAFASGLWIGENWEEVLTIGERLGYFDHLYVIHLNNSKYPANSGKDRHANIFHHGHIREADFDKMINSTILKDIPFILETPSDNGVTHEEELAQLNKKWK